MLTYYCPHCWEEIESDSGVCATYGFNLDVCDQWSYEEKLTAALSHQIIDRRMIPAELLGRMNSYRAIPFFARIIENDDTDYYFVRIVMQSVAAITHPDSERIIARACQNPSTLIADFAKSLLKAYA